MPNEKEFMVKEGVFNFVLGAALICILALLPALAQRRQSNPLARLEQALQAAGANALSSTEQTGIGNLIRSSSIAPPSSTAVSSLEANIISGTADPTDVGTITGAMTSNYTARVNFAISVVQMLNSGDASRVKALVTKFGNDRVVRLLESLAGGGSGAGAFGAGAGPAGFRSRAQ